MKKFFLVMLAMIMALSLVSVNAEVYGSIEGTWDMCGGIIGGVEMEEADLQANLDLYGGSLQFVFYADGTAEMVQGNGSVIPGYYETINEYGIGVAFEMDGVQLAYICQLTLVDDQLVMLVTVDEVDYLYFMQYDEIMDAVV